MGFAPLYHPTIQAFGCHRPRPHSVIAGHRVRAKRGPMTGAAEAILG